MIEDAHKIYAYITNELVQDVCVNLTYTFAVMNAKELYGSSAFVVRCNRYYVKPGDIYRDGKFYRKNESDELEELPYIPSQLDILARLKEESYEIAVSIKQLKESKNV